MKSGPFPRAATPLYTSVYAGSPLLGICLAIFALIALGVAFSAYYVGQEKIVYYWDWGEYWLKYNKLVDRILTQPLPALRNVLGSVRYEDYNLFPLVTLLPAGLSFGTGRVVYVAAITAFSLVPAAVLLSAVVWRISARPFSWAGLLLCTVGVVALHPLWAPVLRGMPDVAGMVMLGVILWMLFSRPLHEQAMARIFVMGGLLAIMVLTRRWYMYWAVCFFPAALLVYGLHVHAEQGDKKAYMGLIKRIVVAGIVFTAALFLVATPLMLRIAGTSYGDIYSAYKFSNSLLEFVQKAVDYFGVGVLACAAAGTARLLYRKESRFNALFLLVHAVMVFILFSRTQDFGIQHYYLLVPLVATGIAASILGACAMASRFVGLALSLGILTVVFLSSLYAFFPGARAVAPGFEVAAPRNNYYPMTRNDLAELFRMVGSLDESNGRSSAKIYVLASSEILNSSIMHIACRLDRNTYSFCENIVAVSDVDKRDEFPATFLTATHVLVAEPAQYHLRPEDQRVVGELLSFVLDNSAADGLFSRLSDTFRLDGGVKAAIYSRNRPFTEQDLENLRRRFAAYYAGWKINLPANTQRN